MSDTATIWSDVAEAWERHDSHVDRTTAAPEERLLAQLDLRPGERVVELGAGTGRLGVRLAELVAPGGRVIVSDIAPGMVDVARRRTAGDPAIEVACLNAAATGLPTASVDVVVFCMGLMFVEQPALAVAEMRRLLAPGGRVGVAVWGAPADNPWLTTIGMAAAVNGIVAGGPPVGPGGIFSLGDAEVLATTFAAGGLDDVEVEAVDAPFRFDSVEHYLAVVPSLAGPLAAAWAAATPEQVAATRQTVEQLAAGFLTDDGVELPGRAIVALART